MIESISHKIASRLSDDVLNRIEIEVNLEVLLHEIKENEILDTDHLVSLSLLGIPVLHFLKKYKNISSDEAKGLVLYGYVSFDELMEILTRYTDKPNT